MAISKTKYLASNEEIISLFARHGIEGITEIAPLGDGEFNAAYKVVAGDNRYVLKIAPPKGAKVLSYEQNMMHSGSAKLRRANIIIFFHLLHLYLQIQTPLMIRDMLQANITRHSY